MYTWCNNQDYPFHIYERLDRVVTNSRWLRLFPFASLNNLPIHGSDHGPICLSLNPRIHTKKKKFKLEAMWQQQCSTLPFLN
jgi:hypothetical protein